MENKTITERFIDGLRSAAIELEEFRVQAALGKAEASDKYQETKKKFNEYVHNAKVHLENSKEFTNETTEKAKTIFEQFMVHVRSLDSETEELIKENTGKLKNYVDELEKSLKKD